MEHLYCVNTLWGCTIYRFSTDIAMCACTFVTLQDVQCQERWINSFFFLDRQEILHYIWFILRVLGVWCGEGLHFIILSTKPKQAPLVTYHNLKIRAVCWLQWHLDTGGRHSVTLLHTSSLCWWKVTGQVCALRNAWKTQHTKLLQ